MDGVDITVFSHDLVICGLAGPASGVGSRMMTFIPLALASKASICPNCPPPMMPIVWPGLILIDKVCTAFFGLVVHFLAVVHDFLLEFFIFDA